MARHCPARHRRDALLHLCSPGSRARLCPSGQMINFLFPSKFTLFHKMHCFPPILFPDPHSFPSFLRLQGLRELRGSRAAETHWFRWKEIDVLFTIAVTLLPQECNRWQIITEAGSYGLAEVQFISRDLFTFLTRGQQASSTVQRHIGHEFDSQ